MILSTAGWLVVPLVLVVLAAFGPVRDNGFIAAWDDGENFLDNRDYRGLGMAQVRWAWTTFRLGVYQPLAWLLLEAQYALWGLEPRGYHLTSLGLHAVNTVILYGLTLVLLRRCRHTPGGDPTRAGPVAVALAVALFAAHPLRVEVVAWASCQPYLPCAGSSLLAVLAYLRAFPEGAGAEAESAPRRGWLAVAFVGFALALLCKAVAVSLPVVLLILDVYPLRRLGGGAGRWFGRPAWPVWREKVPFAALSLAFMGLALAAKEHAHSLAAVGHGDIASRLAQACYGIGFYVVRTVLPVHLTALYPLPDRLDWSAPRFLAGIVGTLGVSVALVLGRRRRPGLLAAWLAYLVILAPNLGIARIGRQIAADRYSYLASMALVPPLAAGLGRLAAVGRRSRPVAWGLGLAGLATVAALVVLSREQCRTWRTSEALWAHALNHGAARSDLAHNNMGVALADQGRLDEALPQFAEALRLNPANADAHYNLGLALSKLGRSGEATARLVAALRLDPDLAGAYNELGVILLEQGRLDDALRRLRRAVRLDPDHFAARVNYGIGLSRQGRSSEAAAQFRAALRLEPGHPLALQGLAAALQAQNRRPPP